MATVSRLCRRCTTFLRSKTPLSSATHVQSRVAAAGTSVRSNAGGQPTLPGNHWTFTMRHMSTDALIEPKHKHVVAASLQIPEAPPMTDSDTRLDVDVALEEIGNEEATYKVVPCTVPTESFSLRDYVDESETLNKLVQLGVALWKLEQRPNVGTMLLKLDFETDVVPRLVFLKRIGVENSGLAYILSRNPFILKEDVDHLQSRVNYLVSKKFSPETVASMVTRAPYLLNFSVKRIDNRLAFYQSQLRLNPSTTRDIVARLPRLLCGSLEPVKENLKVCQIELGFKENEIQHIVTRVPNVLSMNKQKLTQTFHYIHNTMKVPHHLIVKFPQVFNSRLLRIQERHLFLAYLGKAQYAPDQPNYVALDRFVSLPNDAFCAELASATLDDFIAFQKTM